MEKIITSESLSFKEFLHYPDIVVWENTVTFISGESGCGKSTLLKLLNGTVSPSSGSVVYRGIDISTLDKIELRREVVLVKQVPYLFRGNIHHNFAAFHEIHESACPSITEINDYLQLCYIPAPLETQCDTMSGGERQRVFLSIALSLMPKVLLLDEPTSALNKELSNDVLNHIIKYCKQRNIALVIISHDTQLQSLFAEKIIELGKSK